jgi:hypothetical protein
MDAAPLRTRPSSIFALPSIIIIPPVIPIAALIPAVAVMIIHPGVVVVAPIPLIHHNRPQTRAVPIAVVVIEAAICVIPEPNCAVPVPAVPAVPVVAMDNADWPRDQDPADNGTAPNGDACNDVLSG